MRVRITGMSYDQVLSDMAGRIQTTLELTDHKVMFSSLPDEASEGETESIDLLVARFCSPENISQAGWFLNDLKRVEGKNSGIRVLLFTDDKALSFLEAEPRWPEVSSAVKPIVGKDFTVEEIVSAINEIKPAPIAAAN